MGLAEFRKLTLISAPAGYGKTTLVVDWIHALSDSKRVAWISLDEGDNDPARLLNYLILGFKRIDETAGQTAQNLLNLSQLPRLQVIFDELLNDLAAIKGHVVLVLDDYHILNNPQIHNGLEYFIDHQPAQVHLVIITREDPPLPVSRLRARNQMTEIRAADLSFTLDEAGQFFHQSMNMELAAEVVSILEKRTEGWVVGLQLAALALQHLPDPNEFIQTFRGTHRYILDYLAEEVLRQQNEDIRNFLVQTAVLEKFNAPLCDAVTGRSDSQSLIFQLEQSNLFIIPLDDERTWYRYHHLFADYLRAGLAKSEQARLQEKASHWCEENDLVFDAVNYALSSGNLEMAADVIERAIQKVSAWSGGEIATLVGWLNALPDQLLRSRPALSLHASRVWYIIGQIELSKKYLDQAETSLREWPASDPRTNTLLATAAVYRGSLAILQGEFDAAIERAAYALRQLPEDEVYARARATEILGFVYELSGDLARASQFFIQASDLASTAGVSFMAVVSRCEAALVQINQGKLHLATHTVRQGIQFAGEKRIPPLGFAWYVLAKIAWERNELASAEKYLLDGLELSRRGGLIDDQRYELMLLACVKQSSGDSTAALSFMEQAHAIVLTFGIPHLVDISSAHLARIQLAAGMVEAARDWAQAYCEQRSSHPGNYIREFEDLTLARADLATGENEQAQIILSPLFEQANAAGRIRISIEAAILLALAAQEKHQSAIAEEWLVKALKLAQPDGFLRLFLDEGFQIKELLSKVRNAVPEFADQIMRAMPDQFQGVPVKTLNPANDRLINPLSEQELRVLELIVAGKSNQEIAEALVISVGTAKWHVHNILQKLDVKNRPQAIALARELGIAS